MKAPKRKRLAKVPLSDPLSLVKYFNFHGQACDACHKSKRRCDGTGMYSISSFLNRSHHSTAAPCSNWSVYYIPRLAAHAHLFTSYYASKACSYTDSSGRPVPAPRPLRSERQDGDHKSTQLSSSSLPTPPSHDREHEEDYVPTPHNHPSTHPDISRKRFRNERGNAIPTEDISTPLLPVMDAPNFDRSSSMGLDHALTRELTNRALIHRSLTRCNDFLLQSSSHTVTPPALLYTNRLFQPYCPIIAFRLISYMPFVHLPLPSPDNHGFAPPLHASLESSLHGRPFQLCSIVRVGYYVNPVSKLRKRCVSYNSTI